jgi:two-component SAPR family response regulator
LRTAAELLKAGEYERLAELLDRVRSGSDRERDPIATHTLDLARRISLACSQSQAEAEWHQKACQEAVQRQDQLRHQLDSLLHLDGVVEESAPAPELSAQGGRPSILERMQSLLRRRPEPQSPEEAPRQDRVPPVEVRAPVLEEPEPEPAKDKEEPPPALVVYCLGQFRVYQEEHLLAEWEGLKAKCILKYLVANHGTPIVKDVLMDVFWPDADPEAARRNLHQAVYSLRRTFRQRRPDLPYVLFENDSYLLNPDLPIWVDVEEFERHVRLGQGFEESGNCADAMVEYGIAEGLYEGDYLEEDPYEDWLQAQRHRLQSIYMQIANCLGKYYVQQGGHTAAIALCRKILALDNCCEEAHRRLMQCYLAQGQRHLAVRQYQACAQALKDELDLTPCERTMALYERIPYSM